jgi:hypothetical protein
MFKTEIHVMYEIMLGETVIKFIDFGFCSLFINALQLHRLFLINI